MGQTVLFPLFFISTRVGTGQEPEAALEDGGPVIWCAL